MLVLATGFLVALISGLPGWTANAIVALTWYPVRTAFWSHDSLYRIMRLQRLTTSVLWSHTTEIPPIASLMSNGRTVVEELVDSVEEPFIVETDVNPATSSSPSVH